MYRGKPSVLLIHSDDVHRAALGFVLRKHDLEVRETSNLEQAVKSNSNDAIGVIVIDSSLCDQNFTELVTRVRKHNRLGNAAVILIGPLQSREQVLEAGKNGVRAIFIHKGFSIDTFVARVREMLDTKIAPADATNRSEPAPVSSKAAHPAEAINSASVPVQHEKVRSKDVLTKLADMPRIPVFEFTVTEIMQLSCSSGAEWDEFAEILHRDPAASLHVISRANRMDIRGDRDPVENVIAAIQMLGVREFHKLMESLPVLQGGAAANWWNGENTLASTVAISRIARLLTRKLQFADAESIGLVALLHDLGRPTLACLYPQAAAIMASSQIPEGLRTVDIERKILGLDHAIIGGLLLEHHSLPGWFSECVAHHHTPETVRPSIQSRATIAISILQTAEQILRALFGRISPDEILDAVPHSFLTALEQSKCNSARLISECAATVREAITELGFYLPNISNFRMGGSQSIEVLHYVNPKPTEIDPVRLFASRHAKQIIDVPLSQMKNAAAAGLPMTINLQHVQGAASQLAAIQRLQEQTGLRAGILLNESLDAEQTSMITGNESLPCVRLPASTSALSRLLDTLSLPARAAA